MVVTASLVGAPGLGADVYRAVSQINVGQGFEAGLSIVFIAIILDRITQNLRKPAYENMSSRKIVFSILAVLFIITAIVLCILKTIRRMRIIMHRCPNRIMKLLGLNLEQD